MPYYRVVDIIHRKAVALSLQVLMSNRLLKKLLKALLKVNTRQLHLHRTCTYIFSLNSGIFPHPPENGSINIKKDVTITNIYRQQSTKETNTSTNGREKHKLIATILGSMISFCVFFVLWSYFVFYKRRILSFSPAVLLTNTFDPTNL